MGLRDTLNQKPLLGWIVAVIALIVATVFVLKSATSDAPDSVEQRSQQVTIRCTETGREWTMNRGQFERLLLTQDGLIDPTKGIPSQFAEGRPTGVLVNKGEWESTVKRINAMKKKIGGG